MVKTVTESVLIERMNRKLANDSGHLYEVDPGEDNDFCRFEIIVNDGDGHYSMLGFNDLDPYARDWGLLASDEVLEA